MQISPIILLVDIVDNNKRICVCAFKKYCFETAGEGSVEHCDFSRFFGDKYVGLL